MTFSNVTKKGTKCYLYFDAKLDGINYILSKYDTILTRTDFSTTVTETTTGTIYKSLDESQYDNDGEVYYFAGNPTDNWVQFGGYYWRIIRINGDGSIRMIYQGDVSGGPVEEGESTQIGTSAFNTDYNDNAYIGYMYTLNEVHGLGTDSEIKKVLDGWYQNNLISVAAKIDGNAGFCGDREPSTSSSTSNGSGGTDTTGTYYGGYIRLSRNKQPTFECQNESDLYTTSGSEQGNKALTYPIGLISLDEAWYAGGYTSNNTSYYLYTNQYYWTLSPFSFDIGSASVFYVSSSGGLGNGSVAWVVPGVRPVINLKADVTITGSGTTTDPYQVA